MDKLKILRHRQPLTRTLRRLARGELIVGILGGSISFDTGHNWPDPVTAWLGETFPQCRLIVENAAIGATGSDSACLRADREIIGRGCDLTFVEYAVNDLGTPSERRSRTREGLIRKLLAAGQDVVLVYTFSQPMYPEMMAGRVPASIAEFEVLAEHYGLGSVWMGLHAFREIQKGRMKWDEWLPDGLHPIHRGSLSYAEAVTEFLASELTGRKSARTTRPVSQKLPAPLFPLHWQMTSVLPLTDIHTEGPWLLRRIHSDRHIDQVLETQAPGARFSFKFKGRGLALALQYGKKSADFAYRIDCGDWTTVALDRPAWVGDRSRIDPWVLSDELSPGSHAFELKVIHGDRPECQGTECRLAQVGVITAS